MLNNYVLILRTTHQMSSKNLAAPTSESKLPPRFQTAPGSYSLSPASPARRPASCYTTSRSTPPRTGDRYEPEAHADGGIDRRVPRNVRADPAGHRRRRHGRAVSFEESGRDHPRRFYQHHPGLGPRRDHGHLRRRKNFGSSSESGRYPGARGISWFSVAQGAALFGRADC